MQVEEKTTEKCYPGSVLQSDHIKMFVGKGLLIVDDTFDELRLRNTKYDVRLGKAYFKAGNYGNLDESSNPLLEIGPGELVFVESYEVFNMPENVVARYDLRVGGCVAGIGLQTGLQVDPLYYGRIFCPLFNFSDTAFTLRYKEQLASVEFSYTTPPPTPMKPFGSERQRLLSLSQILPDVPRRSGLESLWTSAKEKEETLEKRLLEYDEKATRVHARVDSMVGAVFQAMAAMIAVVAVIAAVMSFILTAKEELPSLLSMLVSLTVFIVIVVGCLVLLIKTMRKISEDKDGKQK